MLHFYCDSECFWKVDMFGMDAQTSFFATSEVARGSPNGVCKGSRVHAGNVSMQMVGFFDWRTDFTMVAIAQVP
jgi:hypothetical protein